MSLPAGSGSFQTNPIPFSTPSFPTARGDKILSTVYFCGALKLMVGINKWRKRSLYCNPFCVGLLQPAWTVT